MYTLEKPSFPVNDVFDLCVGAIDDPDLVARLGAAKSTITANEQLYDTHATSAQLNLIARVPGIGLATKDELVSLYADHLSATRGAGRSVYDAIKNAAPNKLCPLCSIGSVAHIDHHLPKKRYPDLSVLPLNLVPACHFCNDTKKARFPMTAGEQTFHPYYDAHLLDEQWIAATLNYGTPLVIMFSVVAPSSWSSTNQERVARHFKICGLGTSFGTSANERLVSLKRRLLRLHHRGGAAEVQAYLEEERESYEDKPNSWQHVFFDALARDTWFVDGGFVKIADPKP